VLFAELEKISPTAFKDRAVEKKPEGEEIPKGGVVLYCTSWCPDCRRARAWLEQNHIVYTEVNIDRNPAAARQVRQWANGSQTTPTFDIDGTIVVDFKIKELERLLLKK